MLLQNTVAQKRTAHFISEVNRSCLVTHCLSGYMYASDLVEAEADGQCAYPLQSETPWCQFRILFHKLLLVVH